MDGQVHDLEQATKNAGSGVERQRYERDLAQLRAGLKGEREAAYHIDFHLKGNRNWAVIHDLRVEWNERVAQIDHLLIDRFLEIYVIESKSFRTKIRQANGGWERLNFNHWEGIACPMEQNQRHIIVLEELINETKIAPTRLGLPMKPSFHNVVVVQPSCSIVGKLPKDTRIYRMDKLISKIRGEDPSSLIILKMISQETLHAFAAELVSHHRPAPKPFLQQKATISPVSAKSEASPRCQGCGGPLTSAEASYCRANASRFAAQMLCRKCQSHARSTQQKPVEKLSGQNATQSEIGDRCANCGTGVDKKVVAFCRFNSTRFAGRVLCRTCQQSEAYSDR